LSTLHGQGRSPPLIPHYGDKYILLTERAATCSRAFKHFCILEYINK